MKRPATPDQTVPSRRPRLHPPDAQPEAAEEDYPTPPTAVEDVPVVYPSVEQRGGSTDSPPGRQTDTVVATSFAESGTEEVEDAGPSQVFLKCC